MILDADEYIEIFGGFRLLNSEIGNDRKLIDEMIVKMPHEFSSP